ncbi:MAG: ATP-binding cassette domain-containing protein [Eggerthellaceae bacterium]|nr:ATP-binding cassette domain-containing protein [Eggerthellaceae bacterium]
MPDTLLHIENLSIGYGRSCVAQGITCAINRGDLLCVMGRNGSGKTTLIKTLLGIIEPVSGSITYESSVLKGYLPQLTTHQIDVPANVWEVVLSGRVARLGKRFFYNAIDYHRVRESLEKVHMDDMRFQSFSRLSGGQQRRVLIARALATEADLIVMDEPMAGLDTNSREELYELLDTLRRDGISLIVVSHDELLAKRYATYILNLDNYHAHQDTCDCDHGEVGDR